MILPENKTVLGYRCPHCGSGVLGLCGDFTLSGGRMLKLRCPCGKSDLTVTQTPDRKLHLTVPCLLCAGHHTYTVSPTLFYGRDLFTLTCDSTGMDVCYTGKEAAVSAALEENEKQLKDLFAEAGIAYLTQAAREEAPDVLPDAHIYDIIRFLVKELEADGQIDCPCHNGDYEVEMTPRGIRVFCQNCGGEHLFPTESVTEAQAFLSCDHLSLSDPTEA